MDVALWFALFDFPYIRLILLLIADVALWLALFDLQYITLLDLAADC